MYFRYVARNVHREHMYRLRHCMEVQSINGIEASNIYQEEYTEAVYTETFIMYMRQKGVDT